MGNIAAPQPATNNSTDFTQPALPVSLLRWPICSVDLQIITKSTGWNQGGTERALEYSQISSLTGANYVSIACPYDDITKFTNYVNDARTAGFKINFRCHWNAWEGDNGVGNIATNNSLTSSSTTATCVTQTNHGLNTGDTVSMNGMNETNYRGEFAVTVVNATTFTYTMLGTASSPATGNIGWRWGRQTYLDHTYDFIINNIALFQAGDMFAMCVEAQQAANSGCQFFTNGGTTFNYTLYNAFQINQVRYANYAFAQTALAGNIHTWAISHGVSNLNLNGQTVNTGSSTTTGNSSGLANADFVTYFANRVSVDHYIDSSVITAAAYKTQYALDMAAFNAAFPCTNTAGGGLYIAEWGFYTQDFDTGTSSGSNSTTTLNDTGKSWTTNQYANQYVVVITGGTGNGEVSSIVSNSGTQLVVTTWSGSTPDATSTYSIELGQYVQYQVYNEVMKILVTLAYIIGWNAWNHMGQNSSSLWDNNNGTITTGGRMAVQTLKTAFVLPGMTFTGKLNR